MGFRDGPCICLYGLTICLCGLHNCLYGLLGYLYGLKRGLCGLLSCLYGLMRGLCGLHNCLYGLWILSILCGVRACLYGLVSCLYGLVVGLHGQSDFLWSLRGNLYGLSLYMLVLRGDLCGLTCILCGQGDILYCQWGNLCGLHGQGDRCGGGWGYEFDCCLPIYLPHEAPDHLLEILELLAKVIHMAIQVFLNNVPFDHQIAHLFNLGDIQLFYLVTMVQWQFFLVHNPFMG